MSIFHDDIISDQYYEMQTHKQPITGPTREETKENFIKALGQLPKGISVDAEPSWKPGVIHSVQVHFSKRGIDATAEFKDYSAGGVMKITERYNGTTKTLYRVEGIPDKLETPEGARKWIQTLADRGDAIMQAYRERLPLDHWGERHWSSSPYPAGAVMDAKEFQDRVLQKGAAAYRASHPRRDEAQVRYLMDFGPAAKGSSIRVTWSDKDQEISKVSAELRRRGMNITATLSKSADGMTMRIHMFSKNRWEFPMYHVTGIPGDLSRPADTRKWLLYTVRHMNDIAKTYEARMPADSLALCNMTPRQRAVAEPEGSVITVKQFLEMFPRRDYEEPMLKEDERAQEAVRTQEPSADKEIATQTDAKAPDAQEIAPTDPLDNFLVDDRAEELAEQQEEQKKDERLAEEQQEERK